MADTITFDKKTGGWIGAIAIVLIAGVSVVMINDQPILLTQEQIDMSYVCLGTDNLAFCPGTPTHPEPLSGTSTTCYYTNDLGKDTYTRCTNSIFVKLEPYLDMKGLTLEEYLAQFPSSDQSPEPEPVIKTSDRKGDGVCTPDGCTYTK